MNDSTYKEIYNNMIISNYSFDEIRLYFFIKFNIDINIDLNHLLIDPINIFSPNRVGQEEFRNSLMKRFNGKCILTGAKNPSVLNACHIIPFSDTQNMHVDNGLLLYSAYHDLFDNYVWSINPKTLNVEINY